MPQTHKVTFDRHDRSFRPVLLHEQDPRDPNVALLRNLAKLLRCDIHCTRGAEWTVLAPAPVVGDRLDLYYGYSPPGEPDRQGPLSKACGIALEPRFGPLKTSHVHGRGYLVLAREDHVPVAQIIDRTVYILVPVHLVHPNLQHQLFGRIMQAVRHALPDASTPWHERLAKMGLSNDERTLVRLVEEWSGKRPNQVHQRGIERQIDRLNAQLAECYARLSQLHRWEERNARSDDTSPTARLQGELTRLATVEKVDKVFGRQGGLHVTTTPLIGEHAGTRYSLGRYEMRFCQDGTLHVWSLGPTHPKGVPHPHIDPHSGFACFGSVNRTLQQALGERRLHAAAHLVIQWLAHGYTEGQTAYPLTEWPEAA